jgi:hypothetical protein
MAGAAAAVFMLAIALLGSAAMPAPALASADNCLACHPQAHVGDWSATHGTELMDSQVSESTCNDCHDASYCSNCHASENISPTQ